MFWRLSIFKETNRQIDTDRPTGRWAERQTGRDRQAGRQTGRQRCRRLERQTSRGTGRRTGGRIGSSETDRQSQTDKLRDRHEEPGRHRHTERQIIYRAERRTDRQAETM